MLMTASAIERLLSDLATESRALRCELGELDEQLRHLRDEADEARLRSLISETPLDAGQQRVAVRAVAAMRRDREARARRLASLESRQDDLLDQLRQGR